jgi:hypothetical protein
MISGIITALLLCLFVLGALLLWRPAVSSQMRAHAAIPLLGEEDMSIRDISRSTSGEHSEQQP